jgi:MEMO1 family protein
MLRVRPPAVAGMFYPGDSERLASDISSLLGAVDVPRNERLPKAIVVPHAGYVYSGPIAASAFARLRSGRDQIRRVILLGPAHRVAVMGMALPAANAFDTPLGRIVIDEPAVLPLGLVRDAAAHAREHSLEVELPFLQSVLAAFQLVPIAVGQAMPEDVAAVLDALWGGPETLIVISSDLSHYLPYAQARVVDARTAQKILALDGSLGYDEACGAAPLNGLLLLARRRGLVPVQLDLRTSGDTAGSKGEVVGYGAFAFYEGIAA